MIDIFADRLDFNADPAQFKGTFVYFLHCVHSYIACKRIRRHYSEVFKLHCITDGYDFKRFLVRKIVRYFIAFRIVFYNIGGIRYILYFLLLKPPGQLLFDILKRITVRNPRNRKFVYIFLSVTLENLYKRAKCVI